ncbi:MAG TPA: hypothetical protein VFW11_22245 [Cyclobacteriaceae bacterium]|nr:hypothetical protein [Cyclobacteriaceae bacterium]
MEKQTQKLSALDSIRSKTNESFGKLKHSYDSVTSIVDKATSHIQHRIDSLNNLNLPKNDLTSKLDSITQWRVQKLKGIQTKVDELKSSANEEIQSLDLPKELAEKSGQLTSLVDKYDATIPDTSSPDLNVGGNLSLDLPKIDNPLSGRSLPGINNPLSGQQLPTAPEMNLPDANLPDVNIPSTDINGVSDQISQYQNKITEAGPQNLEDVQAIAEKEASNYAQLGDVQKQMSEADQLANISQLKDEKAVKEKLKEEVKKQAVNHFAGKEQQLQQAMEQMSKYKKKYESVQSLAELPKKQPNPLHNKPFIERLVPGIALQIHRKDAWMVDFNPYVGYRFNEHLTAGLGWNQRIAYNFDINEFQQHFQIFGPRVYGEYKVGKGFSGRLEAEYMKTIVPSQFSSGQTDDKGREWVFSTMAGLKKDYRFVGRVKGTVMLMYNLYDPSNRSPYERLNMRFGFEFPLKPKAKS